MADQGAQILYVAASVIVTVATALGFLFRYPEEHFSQALSEAEAQRWDDARNEMAELIAELTTSVDDSVNYFTNDLTNPDDVDDYIEEFFEGPADFSKLEASLGAVKSPKMVKRRCWYGALFSPILFGVSSIFGGAAWFASDTVFSQYFLVAASAAAIFGVVSVGVYLWYRNKMQILSDDQRFIT